MKKRTKYFIGEDKIDHNGDIFDYIRELHDYLWRFVRVILPGASGSLSDFVDKAIEKAELFTPKPDESRLLRNEEIDGYVGKPSFKGAHDDVWEYLQREDLHQLTEAQRDLTASIKDQECQARVERIIKKIEQKFKEGSYQSGTYHYYSILCEVWQNLKKEESIE